MTRNIFIFSLYHFLNIFHKIQIKKLNGKNYFVYIFEK